MAPAGLLLPLLAALAAPVTAPPAAITPAPPGTFVAFPFPIQVKTLPNGLRVALVPYDSPGLVAYYTLVRVGSRNEPEAGRSGYAHFFEHMMFRGTRAHPGDEYNATVTRLGLDTNAFTDFDMTVYHLYGPSRALPTIIEYEGDRFRNLEFSEAQFRTEAGAILGEYAKSASSPDLLLYEKMLGTAYDRHTYRHTVIGFLDDIKKMPEGFAYAREFFRRYYTPDNATIVIVGDFDVPRTLELIAKAYGGWKGKLAPVAVPVEPPQRKARRAAVAWEAPTLPRIWVAWHVPGAADVKATAVSLVLNAYLFGPTSPVYQDLVLGRQLVDGLDATGSVQRDPTLFGALARVKKAEDVAAVEQSIAGAAGDLARGTVDRGRLADVISNATYSAALALDRADSVAATLAVNTTYTGDLQFLNKLYAQVEAVTAADLTAFARRWLTEANRTTVTLATRKEVAK
jgi:zinc protease